MNIKFLNKKTYIYYVVYEGLSDAGKTGRGSFVVDLRSKPSKRDIIQRLSDSVVLASTQGNTATGKPSIPVTHGIIILFYQKIEE